MWWQTSAHASDASGTHPQPIASAIDGREYLVYARYGGQLKLDLRSTPESASFRFTWIDLVESKEARAGTVSGGAIRSFHAPEDYPGQLNYKDWLLHLVKID